MKKSVDIIVFGATGVTGKFTVLQLARLTKETKYLDIKWGIAGRSKKKLETLITEIQNAGFDFKYIPVIECNADNEESLKNMLRVTKVIVNCTGVNISRSLQIVEVCIETGTHYVDMSSEIFHILTLYLHYDKIAKSANILVIPCFGFSSILMEAGMIYLDKKFQGTLHSVECYAENFLSLPSKALLHNGTWTSLVHVLMNFKEYLVIKNEISLIAIEPEREKNKRPFFVRNNGQLWFTWPGVENDTVLMFQQCLYEEHGRNPINFNAYTTCEKWYQFLIIPAMYIYYYLCYFKCFAKLLINYPRVFTFGLISEKGPTHFLLNGKGWETFDQKCEPTKTMSVKVSGKDPYDSTVFAVILSAITVIKDRWNMPSGGVIMPGAAFYNTDIIYRLKDGFTFEVLE